MLQNANIIGFIPSADLQISKSFYEDTLCLPLKKADDYALEFALGPSTLRVTQVPGLRCASYTILGWEVDDIEAVVTVLKTKGIEFEKYNGLDQNEISICTFPGNNKVAWFKDPDGNVLSLAQLGS